VVSYLPPKVGPDLGPRRRFRVNGTRQGATLQIQLHRSG
jgi:hypothetical protein